jgi:site-specific recombinase XerD
MNEYAESGKIGSSTGEIIKRTAKKVKEFDPTANFNINDEWLDNFCAYLISNGTKTNGVGLHLRNIRTVFNYARKKRITKEYPFLDYQIKVEKKPIRNMTIEQLRKFRDFPCEAWQVEYRDVFMLMVYLAGVNIGDLMECKGLVNGRLVYSRRKTAHPLSIYVCPEAKKLIEKYKGENWLLSPSDRYKDYHGYMHKMNDGLKKIGETKIVKDKVGKMRKHQVTPVYDGLSTYVARYTWASLAAECGIQRDIIAACLGHSWADVTSHYIAYSQKLMDEAIMKVAEYINKDRDI